MLSVSGHKSQYRMAPTGHLCSATDWDTTDNNIAVAVHTPELAMSSANNQCTWSWRQPDIATCNYYDYILLKLVPFNKKYIPDKLLMIY